MTFSLFVGEGEKSVLGLQGGGRKEEVRRQFIKYQSWKLREGKGVSREV